MTTNVPDSSLDDVNECSSCGATNSNSHGMCDPCHYYTTTIDDDPQS